MPDLPDDTLGVEIVDYLSHPLVPYYPVPGDKGEDGYDGFVEPEDEPTIPNPEPDPSAPLDALTRWVLFANAISLLCYVVAISVALWFSWAKDEAGLHWLPNLFYVVVPAAAFGLFVNVRGLMSRGRVSNPEPLFAVSTIGLGLHVLSLGLIAMAMAH